MRWDLTLGTGLRLSSSHDGLDTFVEIRGGVRSDIPPIRQRLIRLARIRVERDDMRVSEMHIAVHREHLICPLLGSRNFDDSAQRLSAAPLPIATGLTCSLRTSTDGEAAADVVGLARDIGGPFIE